MTPDKLWKRYLLCNAILRKHPQDDLTACLHYVNLRYKYYKLWFRKAGYST